MTKYTSEQRAALERAAGAQTAVRDQLAEYRSAAEQYVSTARAAGVDDDEIRSTIEATWTRTQTQQTT